MAGLLIWLRNHATEVFGNEFINHKSAALFENLIIVLISRWFQWQYHKHKGWKRISKKFIQSFIWSIEFLVLRRELPTYLFIYSSFALKARYYLPVVPSSPHLPFWRLTLNSGPIKGPLKGIKTAIENVPMIMGKF